MSCRKLLLFALAGYFSYQFWRSYDDKQSADAQNPRTWLAKT
ncbi:MAG TPA: hypothetical protein VIO16_05445 [Dehalococcoidia bacterium]